MRFILNIVLIILSFEACATDAFPSDCKPIAVQAATVTLSGSASIMLINNISDTELWVTHPISQPSASAGWSSRLQAKHWAALALESQSFELSCIESKPGHEQQVPCSGVIRVCQWPVSSDKEKHAKTFWAGENMTLSALLAHLNERGFRLPQAPTST